MESDSLVSPPMVQVTSTHGEIGNSPGPARSHRHPRGVSRQKTELEFNASTEREDCVFCRDHEPGRVLIPISSLKERLFLYVQKALGTHILREQENISVCIAHLQKVLEHRIDDLLEEDLEQLYKLQEEGIKVLGQYELEEENWLQKFETERTIGEKAADGVARVGGSWRFVLSLAGVLALWMVINGLIIPNATGHEGWDPFPFILLNLFLSCVAAFQGAHA
jgi:hypothetical protein